MFKSRASILRFCAHPFSSTNSGGRVTYLLRIFGRFSCVARLPSLVGARRCDECPIILPLQKPTDRKSVLDRSCCLCPNGGLRRLRVVFAEIKRGPVLRVGRCLAFCFAPGMKSKMVAASPLRGKLSCPPRPTFATAVFALVLISRDEIFPSSSVVSFTLTV